MKAFFWTLLFVASLSAEPWRFVVAGDGRSQGKTPRPEDKNGINVTITTEVIQAVIRENAKLLLWTGDLVLGYTGASNANGTDELESQLLDWRALAQPLYDKKIAVLPCRGNHDAKGGPKALAVWRKVFSGPYQIPDNGPEEEKGITFYYATNNALFIGLDQYFSPGKTVNQVWLSQLLEKNKAPFIFAMGHEPALADGHHKNVMDTTPDKRDDFLVSLIRAGTRAIFFGHDHIYDHMLIKREGSNALPEIHQFVAGTAGAPFYTAENYSGKNGDWSLTRVKNITNTYGYLVVEINGKKAELSFKGRTAPGKYEVMDQFRYEVK